MNQHRLRPYATVTMVCTMFFLVITGLVLYLAPYGPGSRYWSFLGLSKHQYRDIHFCFSLLVIILIVMHGMFNIKGLIKYFKFNQKLCLHPLVFAIFISLATLAIAFTIG